MTKKFFQGLLLFFVAAVLSVGFVSCKDDDETGFSLVGTWKCEYVENDGDSWYELYTFNSNGTGAWQEFVYENRKWELDDYEYFDYVFDSKASIVKCIFGDGIVTKKVEVVSSNKVIVDGDIYIRQ